MRVVYLSTSDGPVQFLPLVDSGLTPAESVERDLDMAAAEHIRSLNGDERAMNRYEKPDVGFYLKVETADQLILMESRVATSEGYLWNSTWTEQVEVGRIHLQEMEGAPELPRAAVGSTATLIRSRKSTRPNLVYMKELSAELGRIREAVADDE